MPASPAWAHPHVFLNTHVTIVFDQKGLAGARVEWVFDEMFSSMIIFDFDKNENGMFEPAEVAAVKKGAFNNLKNFDYFTHVKINGKPFEVSYVKDFNAEIKEGRLIYRFFAPFHVTATGRFKEIKLAIYDKSFYSSVFLGKNPVSYENSDSFEINHSIAKNRQEAYYYGQVYPEEITMRFKVKNG